MCVKTPFGVVLFFLAIVLFSFPSESPAQTDKTYGLAVKPPSAYLRFELYTNHGVSGISASLRF
jgi:hypothetical protein